MSIQLDPKRDAALIKRIAGDPTTTTAQKRPAKPAVRPRDARPTLPRAGRAASTGLGTFIAAGWHWTVVVGKGYKLHHPDGRATGWCVSESAACQEAKTL
jgi:hypothetical protein